MVPVGLAVGWEALVDDRVYDVDGVELPDDDTTTPGVIVEI